MKLLQLHLNIKIPLHKHTSTYIFTFIEEAKNQATSQPTL